MNLFKSLRDIYGKTTVKHLRDLENCERKLARHRNHLVYTLRCRDLSLTPPSLKIKCPINTKKAKDIILQAQRNLLRERVRVINNKLVNLKSQKSDLEKKLKAIIPAKSELDKEISSHLARIRENTFEKTKCRHVRKLQNLTERDQNKKSKHGLSTGATEPDLTGTQLKKWVVNLSKYKLSRAQNNVLAKGLDYAVSPTNVCSNEFVIATELACKKLTHPEAIQLRAKVTSALKSSKPPKSNLSKDERQAVKDLKKEDSIIILPADKGRATVILDKDEYNEKVNNLLGDTKTYEELSSDPTQKYKRKLVAILTRLNEEDKITFGKYKQLYPTAENIPRLYCTPKIHKPNAPLRPIVDYTSTIGYATSRWLADILGPMLGNTVHHVKNSTHLAEELVDILIDEGAILNSHDVVSLFTCTPISKVLDIVKDRVSKERWLRDYNQSQGFNLTADDVYS
ncbi:uncharacterized protein [Amphiura filiformis]|uniref:uncharacterized protein n=1 Tax=Amphiura filiformis TaxID=82378 RepID=UPI003B2108EB